MPGKRLNTLRQFHLLIVRETAGFSWQVRYGRNATMVEGSSGTYATQAKAEAEGMIVLAQHRLITANSARRSSEPEEP